MLCSTEKGQTAIKLVSPSVLHTIYTLGTDVFAEPLGIEPSQQDLESRSPPWNMGTLALILNVL